MTNPKVIQIDPDEDLTPEKALSILIAGCRKLQLDWETHMVMAKAAKTLEEVIKKSSSN